MALGHIHRHQVLARDTSWIVYPGNLQGRSLKPSERGAKGAVVVEVEDERTTALEHVALDRVRFEQVSLDVSPCADLVALERLLIDAAEQLRGAIGERGLVVRARLTGRAELRGVLRRPGVLPDLLTALRDGVQGVRPFVWWDSIEDETRSEIDRESLRAGNDFRAALLAESDALAADDSFFRDLAGGIPPRLRGVALPEAAESELEALRLDGEALALDALESEVEA